MKLIIAGGRDFNDYELLELECKAYISLNLGDDWLYKDNDWLDRNIFIINGGCEGADKLGKKFSDDYEVSSITINANWKLSGKSAGPIRNNQMADICSHAIIFWDGSSRGSKNMIDICIQRNIPYKVIKY